MKKKFSEIKKGDQIKVWVDADIVGNPIYQTYKALEDSEGHRVKVRVQGMNAIFSHQDPDVLVDIIEGENT